MDMEATGHTSGNLNVKQVQYQAKCEGSRKEESNYSRINAKVPIGRRGGV